MSEQQQSHAGTDPLGGAEKPEGRPPEAVEAESNGSVPKIRKKRRGRRLTKPDATPKRQQYSGEQRLLVFHVWQRTS